MLPKPLGKTAWLIHCVDSHTQIHCVVFHQLCQGMTCDGLRLVKFAVPASLSFPGMQSSELLPKQDCSAYHLTGCRKAKFCL